MEKKDNNEILNKKKIAILYLISSICWIISGIFEPLGKSGSILSYVFGGILFLLSMFYFYNYKKDKKC